GTPRRAPPARARRARRSPRRWRRSTPRRGLLPCRAEVASQPDVAPAEERLVEEGLQPAQLAHPRREGDLVDDPAAAAGQVEQRPVVPPCRGGPERGALAKAASGRVGREDELVVVDRQQSSEQ